MSEMQPLLKRKPAINDDETWLPFMDVIDMSKYVHSAMLHICMRYT